MAFLSFFISVFILYFPSLIHSQQPYVGLSTTDCNRVDTSNSNSALGYSCNGLNTTCQAYLTFRSLPPFNNVSSISTLLSSDPSQLSQINSVSETHTFETDKLVIVPVNCSCSGRFYQSNSSYSVQRGDSYLFIANNTFQALSTCQALQNQNVHAATSLVVGEGITVPLRCACPTKNQTDEGFNYLLSYLVAVGDDISLISSRFGVDSGKIFEANSLSGTVILPFTTLIIPLENPPNSSLTVEPPSSAPVTPPPPPPPPPSSDEDSDKTWIYIVAGVLGGIALFFIFGTIIFCKFFYRRKNEPDSTMVSKSFEAIEKPLNKKFDEESQDFLESISDVAQSLKVYKFQELQSATEDFSSSCLIKGSFYRGEINGDLAAIKKVNGDVSKEITLLNKINHSNVIRLSGVCFNEGNWYLVYEFAVNGTLSDWIFGNKNEGKFLEWTQRLQIALDVATGLSYMHSFTDPPHVHKNINSSNVLLDSDFRAKIANFSLARSTEGQEEGEFALTRHIVGTKGFMAPEYLENGLVSTKLDVYAFGVLMVEMITGKQASALSAEENNMNLSDVLSALLNKEDEEQSLRQFMDPNLEGKYPLGLAQLVIKLTDGCLKKNPTIRPAMYEIEHALSNILNASLAL